jgi:hypothetical protein
MKFTVAIFDRRFPIPFQSAQKGPRGILSRLRANHLDFLAHVVRSLFCDASLHGHDLPLSKDAS